MSKKCHICGYDCNNHHHPLDECGPHISSLVRCAECGYWWVAVRPEDTEKLECPNCRRMTVIIESHDKETMG